VKHFSLKCFAGFLPINNKVVRSNHGVTFREQAIIWLNQMKHRKRRPVAPSTLATWESCLNNWLNPNIGDMPLDSIKNLVLKSIGTTMVGGGLGASAIRDYTNVVKMVVAWAVLVKLWESTSRTFPGTAPQSKSSRKYGGTRSTIS
jgi:hypothetical protein